MSSQAVVGPEFVLAVKYKYFPFLSQTAERASLIPSVSCALLPVASEFTNTARMWFCISFVYATHSLSGDHDGSSVRSGVSNTSESILTGVPLSRSTYQTLSRLSVYATFLLSGDHFGS